MKAAVLRDGAFYVEERPRPVPGPGQVLAKTQACGICGSDLHLFKHAHEMWQQAKAMGVEIDDLSKDLIMGHEYVAEIVEFGPDTQKTLAVGDRVCSMPFLQQGAEILPIGATKKTGGAYAEYLLLSESTLLKVDPQVPVEAAALTEPLAIAVHAIAKGRFQPGDVAIVLGCGPIGLSIIALLKSRGVDHIVASDLSAKRRALAETLGASASVDPRQASPYATLAAAAPGRPTLVFECTGVPGVMGQAVLEAPLGARLVVAGIAPGEDKLIPMVAISKELMIQYVSYYTPEEFAQALTLLSSNAVNWRPMITGRVTLGGIGQAFKALQDPAEAHAKILIEPWSSGNQL